MKVGYDPGSIPQQVQRTVEHTPKGGDIYQFAADYPGVMVSLLGALLIVIWFFIRKK